MTEQTARIVCAELQPNEGDYLQRNLPDGTLLLECAADDCPLDQIRTAEVLSVFIHSTVDKNMLDQLPNLRFIATRSTGYDHIDIDECNRRGIPVANVPRYGENTVAEHTFGLMLALSRKISKAYQRTIASDFSLEGLEGFDLKDKTLGVVGAGSIGLHVIRIAKGFGMRVIAFDVQENHLIAEVLGFEYVPLDTLFTNADIITLHAPYNAKTHHMINAHTIGEMKRGVLLINTARGGLIDTEALIDGLDQGIIAGAGLDVIEGEELIEEEERVVRAPEAGDQLRMLIRQHILLRRPEVIITPHIAFYSKEAHMRILNTTIENIHAYFAGHPIHVVNYPQQQG
jgi:D-lactate dehydrogenase